MFKFIEFYNRINRDSYSSMFNWRFPEIYVCCGPMWSGKSRQIIQAADRLRYAKVPFIVFKPALDTKAPDSIQTRYKGYTETAVEVDHKNPKEILSKLGDLKPPAYILIDEAQFFSKELVDVVKELNSKGYGFVITGLDLDAEARTFGPMGDLLALATKVDKYTSVCTKCQGISYRTSLKVKDPAFKDDNTKDAANEDAFTVLCMKCFYDFLNS